MSRISVLIASESKEIDILARMIAVSVAARPDMTLAGSDKAAASECVISADDVKTALNEIPASVGCALVLVCRTSEPTDRALRFLALRSDLVVIEVTIGS